MTYHLQIILQRILIFREDHVCIPRRAKVQVLSSVGPLPRLVTYLRTFKNYSLEPITK